MPLIVHQDLPAKAALEAENIFTMSDTRAQSQDIRPLKVAILNLMPTKEVTELQFLRMLSNTPLQVNIDLIRTESYESKNADRGHLRKFYKTFTEIKNNKYDAMIITGAPVERMKYEEVLYWKELKEILDYVRKNVFSALFVCWAAQAALYHYYGVEKHDAGKKIFGVFEFKTIGKNVLTKGFDDIYYVPQSRYTYNKGEDLAGIEDLVVWAERPETGVQLATTRDYRLIFASGHGEYDSETLYNEYIRDKAKGEEITLPSNYFVNDDEDQGIVVKWRSHANLFFANWLNYCVYQETPYDITQIPGKEIL